MIVVTGMHRSGTSLVAMTLEAIGVPFGDHSAFYSADRWNERGYFERRDVMDINSRMITGFGRTGSRSAALASQIGYLRAPRLETIAKRGAAFVDEMREIRDATDDGAIKDPRLCLTWSAWAEQVDLEACVICIRHPFDVVDSLRRRQRIPMMLGFRFWRYHMRALRERTPERTLIVDLDSLIMNPRPELEMMIAGLGLDIDSEAALTNFDATYAPGLTRTRAPEHRPPLSGETAELWDWLVSLRSIPIGGRVE